MIERIFDRTFSNRKSRPFVYGFFLFLFSMLLSTSSRLVETSLKSIITLDQIAPNHWVADIGQLTPGDYYFSAGKTLLSCQLILNESVVAQNWFSDIDTRTSILLGTAFRKEPSGSPKRVEVACNDTAGFSSRLDAAPFVAPFRLGILIHLYRAFISIVFPLLMAVLLIFTVTLPSIRINSNVTRKPSLTMRATLPWQYIFIAAIAFLHSVSLAYFSSYFLSRSEVMFVHIGLRILLSAATICLFGYYSRVRPTLLALHAALFLANCIAFIKNPELINRFYSSIYFFFPFATALSTYDLFRQHRDDSLITLLRSIGVALTFMQVLDCYIMRIPAATYLVSSYSALILCFLSYASLLERADIEREFEFAQKKIRKTERQLGQMARAVTLGEVAAQVAHDIRSPLTALEIASEGVAQLPADHRRLLLLGIARIKDVANDLLEKHRAISLGDGEEYPGGQQNDELLLLLTEELVTEKRIQYRERLGITISLESTAEAYEVFGHVDRTGYKRALSNLVDNAVQATGNGLISITLKCESGWVEVSVTDNGRGIPAQDLQQVLSRPISIGKSDGHGLGLQQVRVAVSRFDGVFDLRSEVGRGTTATLRLKSRPAPSWYATRIEVVPKMYIAILDHDPTVHEIWRRRFSEWTANIENKIQISCFTHSAPFGRWIAQYAIPVIYLVDHELPNESGNGLDLIAEIGIAKNSYLVTDDYDEKELRARCDHYQLKLIPKPLIGQIPIFGTTL